MVECAVWDRAVAGSSPVSPTKTVILAQLVRAADCGSAGLRFDPGILPLASAYCRRFCNAWSHRPGRRYWWRWWIAIDALVDCKIVCVLNRALDKAFCVVLIKHKRFYIWRAIAISCLLVAAMGLLTNHGILKTCHAIKIKAKSIRLKKVIFVKKPHVSNNCIKPGSSTIRGLCSSCFAQRLHRSHYLCLSKGLM